MHSVAGTGSATSCVILHFVMPFQGQAEEGAADYSSSASQQDSAGPLQPVAPS